MDNLTHQMEHLLDPLDLSLVLICYGAQRK